MELIVNFQTRSDRAGFLSGFSTLRILWWHNPGIVNGFWSLPSVFFFRWFSFRFLDDFATAGALTRIARRPWPSLFCLRVLQESSLLSLSKYMKLARSLPASRWLNMASSPPTKNCPNFATEHLDTGTGAYADCISPRGEQSALAKNWQKLKGKTGSGWIGRANWKSSLRPTKLWLQACWNGQKREQWFREAQQQQPVWNRWCDAIRNWSRRQTAVFGTTQQDGK